MGIGAYAGVSLLAAVATVLHAWQTRCGQRSVRSLYVYRCTVRVFKPVAAYTKDRGQGYGRVREAIISYQVPGMYYCIDINRSSTCQLCQQEQTYLVRIKIRCFFCLVLALFYWLTSEPTNQPSASTCFVFLSTARSPQQNPAVQRVNV